MTRLPNWPRLLAAFIEQRRGTPFVWGQNDCALFAADAIQAITGVDLAVEYRGYTDMNGAYATLQAVAGGGLDAAARRALGDPRPNVRLAQRGDLVLVQSDAGDALGICVGSMVACAGPTGITWPALRQARTAWMV